MAYKKTKRRAARRGSPLDPAVRGIAVGVGLGAMGAGLGSFFSSVGKGIK